MKTTRMSPERERLLSLAAAHIMDNGVVNLSLSSLARAIGSNNRMLLYYFGSREALLDEAWELITRRYPVLTGILDDDSLAIDVLLDLAWARLIDPRDRPQLQLFFEFFAFKLRNGGTDRSFLDDIAGGWETLVAARLRGVGIEADLALEHAVAIVAVWRGLQISLLAGADLATLHRSYGHVKEAVLALLPSD